jgi:hypothetical protein
LETLLNDLRIHFQRQGVSYVQQFFQRKQNTGESVNSFISDFLLIQSGLDSLDDRKLVDLFTLGQQPSIRENVILKQPKNLQEAFNVARLKECAISSASLSQVTNQRDSKTVSTLSDSFQEIRELEKWISF